MIDKIIPFLKQGIPATVAMKGMSSVSPKIKSFILSATTAGYGTDYIMDFLRNTFSGSKEGSASYQQGKRKAQGVARPDELANVSQDEQAEGAQKIGQAGLAVGAGLLSGGAALAAAPALAQASRAVAPAMLAGEAAPALAKSVTGAVAPIVKKSRSFSQKAMEGISFFDLSDRAKSNVGKLTKRLEQLEHEGASYTDSSVKKVVNTIRRMLKKPGAIENDIETFEAEQTPQVRNTGQQHSSTDDQFSALLDQFSQKYLS